jgi:hypothetical protein
MPKISATASMGAKLKFFSDYENVSPHISITVERDTLDYVSDDVLVEEAGKLYQKCRAYVQDELEKDIASAKAGKEGKHIGKKVI